MSVFTSSTVTWLWVALDGMFEAGRRDCKFQGILVAVTVKETVNQAGGKRVASAHTVHDMNRIVP